MRDNHRVFNETQQSLCNKLPTIMKLFGVAAVSLAAVLSFGCAGIYVTGQPHHIPHPHWGYKGGGRQGTQTIVVVPAVPQPRTNVIILEGGGHGWDVGPMHRSLSPPFRGSKGPYGHGFGRGGHGGPHPGRR